MRRHAALTVCLLLAACCEPSSDESATATRFAEIRSKPTELAIFLRRMPKGGDLHNHLSGAIYAESYIAWASTTRQQLCVNISTWTIEKWPCEAPERPAVATLTNDQRSRLINALSMRGYVPGQGKATAHDQFFDSFPRFSLAGDDHGGNMLAEVASRAAAQNINYLELMISFQSDEVRKLGGRIGWDDNAASTHEKLLKAGLKDLIPAAARDLDDMEREQRTALNCGKPEPPPACRIVIRYIAQVSRANPIELVFAQAAFALHLVNAERRIVGLNFVQPEDHPRALADYGRQMELLADLNRLVPCKQAPPPSPCPPLTLHAGELTLGLVPPQDLRSHITQAVKVAEARRIGHGVSIVYEDDAEKLLAEMAKRKVLVEINLTSNDVILGVRGNRHPFDLYRRAGVPLALSTDDEGVSRIDLTHEFQRAVETYDLTYADLKVLARNSLTYSFLPGESLWAEAERASMVSACAGVAPGQEKAQEGGACATFLSKSEKARQQWRLEGEFAAFERSITARPRNP